MSYISKMRDVVGGTLPTISSYMETLLDDTTAAAARTTLGMSTWVAGLLDDASAAAARTTLDVYSKAETQGLVIPGSEMAYDETTALWTTTNTTLYNNASSAKITGLSVTVTGEGQPVDVVVNLPLVKHSASALCIAYLMCNGSATAPGGGFYSQTVNASNGRTIFWMQRVVLTNGVSYTFEVGMQAAAGTTTLEPGAAYPNQLSVLRR